MYHTQYVAILPLIGLCLIIMLMTVIHLIYQVYCKKSQAAKNVLKFTIVISIVCMSAAIISASIDLFDIIYYFLTGIDVFHLHNLYLLIVFANLFYYIECIALYTVLFGRLYITFNNVNAIQQYRLSSITVGYILSLIVIAALVMITYCILLIVLDEFSPIFYHILSIGISIICIIDITLNMSILSLFIFKLQQIIIYTYDLSSPIKELSQNDNNNKNYFDNQREFSSEDIKLDRNQEKILNVITKHTFLSICAIISNQLFYASVIGCGYVKDFDKMDACYLIYSNGIRIFEGTINCVILYLSFIMNQNYYYQFCSKCHQGLHQCCSRKTKNKIVQRSINGNYQLL